MYLISIVMKKLLILLALLFVVGCVGPSIPATPQASGLYTNDAYGFSLVPPEGWYIAEASPGVSFIGDYDYLANIVVSVDEDATTLMEYWTEEKDRMERSEMMVGTQTYQEGLITVDGHTAVYIDYTYTLIKDVKAKEIIIVDNGNAYIISYQTEVDMYDDHLQMFEDSLATFSL